VATERVTNLIAEPSRDSDADGHHPNVYLTLGGVSAGGTSGYEAGGKNQRIAGDERHESADKEAGSGKDQGPNHGIEKNRPGLDIPAADLI
jgi:hypothetical protein